MAASPVHPVGSGRVCVGAVAGAHGIRGQVRIKSFTAEPAHVAAYGPVEVEDGSRRFKLQVVGEAKGLVIARLDGIGDRNAAEALRGVALYVSRERLPGTEEDEFLYAELTGLEARTVSGAVLGRVKGVSDFGAGELLDVALAGGGDLMVPFTRDAVPEIDVRGGWLAIVPPEYAPDEDGEEGLG